MDKLYSNTNYESQWKRQLPWGWMRSGKASDMGQKEEPFFLGVRDCEGGAEA